MIRPVRLADASLLAGLHAEAFPDDAWPALGFMTLLANPGNEGYLSLDEGGRAAGLVVMRTAAGETEVITLGVRPGLRGRGHGARLLATVLDRATRRGAEAVFLEVAEDNAAAISLYTKHKFVEVGRRPGYYNRKDGRVTALVMRRDVVAAERRSS